MKLFSFLITAILFNINVQAKELSENIEAYPKDPNIKYLFASTRDTDDAMYLMAWTQKIQRFGNLNYPKLAKKYNLEGELLIYVAIAKDGSLINTRILKTSGHKILDDAARHIVELSAPFSSIPKEVLDDKSHIVIIKKWLFSKNS